MPFLKITLEKLIEGILPDEEIIVIDGNSSDGTTIYLEQLYNNNKIQQYISEPDKNQAHAWNKGFIVANGKIIKKIMDDDVFSLTAIQKCKDWMIENPTIDICISNTLQTQLLHPDLISKDSRLNYYLEWQSGKNTCFSFCDVYMLIKKDTLSFTGLYDTQFKMIDWEFALRCSFLCAKIAYYTGYNSLTVQTPGNVTSLATQENLKNESRIAKAKYGYLGDRAKISLWSEVKIFIGQTIDRSENSASFIGSKTNTILTDEKELKKIYSKLYKVLEEENQKENFNFIC